MYLGTCNYLVLGFMIILVGDILVVLFSGGWSGDDEDVKEVNLVDRGRTVRELKELGELEEWKVRRAKASKQETSKQVELALFRELEA